MKVYSLGHYLNISNLKWLFLRCMSWSRYTGWWLFVLIALSSLSSSCQNNNEETMAKLNKGDMAPDFELPDQDKNMVKLSDYRGKKNVVLYFYPADDTPGCTAEACSFRDNYDEFANADTEVIGVSSNGANSHQKFITKYNLNFKLLTDKGGKVSKAYGVGSFLGILGGRVTFLIDKSGKVVMVFNSQFNATKHVKEALQALEEVK